MDHIEIETPEYPHSAKYYRIVARKNGQCVGHVFAYIIGDAVHKGPDTYYVQVDDLRVDLALRGKGIGRRLMDALKALAKREHCSQIKLACHRKRKAARALYTSMGFVPHGREFRLDL